jgi:ornithine cyclodeaminase/alanine dehydrogenase-like protein (mu-crystallin family)
MPRNARSCGTQAEAHVDLLVRSFPSFSDLYGFDLDRERAEQFTEKVTGKYPTLRVGIAGTARDAVRSAPVVITVTTSSAGYVVSNPFGMSILDVGLIAAVHRQAHLLRLGQVLELR